jgi:hypothetical protein
MTLVMEPINLALLNSVEGSDWAKRTPDAQDPAGKIVDSAESLRRSLHADGVTVDFYKTLPAYQLALDSGKHPWLADL